MCAHWRSVEMRFDSHSIPFHFHVDIPILFLVSKAIYGGLKTRYWKRRDGQKCKVGKRETGKRGTKTAGVENTGKGVYGQPNVTVYVNCC